MNPSVYIYIYIYGVPGVIFTVVGNHTATQVQILDNTVYISHSTNILEKVMHPTIRVDWTL